MKILNYGSLNIDLVYDVPHIVRPGETITSHSFSRFPGGKGLNQSSALAKAGAEVYHAGSIGADGRFLKELLDGFGVKTEFIRETEAPTGNAVIQVDENGQNSIFLFPGANRENDPSEITEVLKAFEAGDFLLLQNEVNDDAFIMEEACARGMKIVLNPSPMDDDILKLPLEKVSYFLLNEIEGAALTGETEPEKIIKVMREKYPQAAVVLTLGGDGSMYADADETVVQDIFPCEVVDTTAAGDTFTGYFLAGIMEGRTPAGCMKRAAMASSIAVSRKGAAVSVPEKEEVDLALEA